MRRGLTRHRLPLAGALLVGMIALGVVPRAGAQSISQVIFLPQVYHVGDVVEARVVVRSTRALELRLPEALPRLSWVIVHSVEHLQRPDGVEVRIVFQPFFVGTRTLPPLDLGDLNLTGVSAFVTPLAGAEITEPHPIRDQLLLPGTRIFVAVALLVTVLVPITIWFAGGWGTRRVRAIVRWYRENRPYRNAKKGLRALSAEVNELDGKRFYIRLLDLARVYLAKRFDPGVLSATTGELGARLTKAGLDETVVQSVVELFRVGDLVKFANRRVTLDERHAHLEQLHNLVLQTHKVRSVSEGRA